MTRNPTLSPPLLHELIFFGAVALTSVRAIFGMWTRSTIAWLLLALLAGACIWWNARQASDPLNQRRHYRFLAITLGVYLSLSLGIGATYYEQLASTSLAWDQRLHQVDQLVFGDTLFRLIRLKMLTWPALATHLCDELFSLAYITLLPLEVAALWALSRDPAALKQFSVGLFTVYGLGFLGYTLVPAMGPTAGMGIEMFGAAPVETLSITHLQYTIVRYLSIKYDVFPSLHAAIPLYMLLFAIRYATLRTLSFATLTLLLIMLSISAVYLGYHYFLDTVVGALLGAIGLCAIEAQSFLESRFVTDMKPANESTHRLQ